MAQTVNLWGATYNAVPAIDVPSGNGTARFTDVSDTTSEASDVLAGKYFYTAEGIRTLGTATGGGGSSVVVVTEEPDTNGGIIKNITAVDISDTTAVASDVAQGKYFYTSSGVKTAGTASTPVLTTKSITTNGTYNASSDNVDGYSSVTVNVSGGGGAWSWMGKNPTLVSNYTRTKEYLKDTGFASWTPSTSATSGIITPPAYSACTVDIYEYDYWIVQKRHVHFDYQSGATGARITDQYYIYVTSAISFPTTINQINFGTMGSVDRASGSTHNGCFYMSSSNNQSYARGISYGLYSSGTPTQTISQTSITPLAATLSGRCSSTYFSTTNANAVDLDTSYYELDMEIWRVDKDTTPGGYNEASIRDMWLNGF